MSGVRVQHATQRNVRFTIVEGDRPYPKPYFCPSPAVGGCGTTHLFKTHHLNLDETGAVIIGDKLYPKIKRLLVLNGFVETNAVKKPPTLGIGVASGKAGAWGNIPIIEGKAG